MNQRSKLTVLGLLLAAASAGCPAGDDRCGGEPGAGCEDAMPQDGAGDGGDGQRDAGRQSPEQARDAGGPGSGREAGASGGGGTDESMDAAAGAAADDGGRADAGRDEGVLPDNLDLQACAIEASVDGEPLGQPPRALAGSDVTLAASDCDGRLELAWYHGSPSDLSFYGGEREIVFRLFARGRFELRASYAGQVRLTREIVVEAAPTPLYSTLLVEPIKPRSIEPAMATVRAIVDSMYVPITEVVATVEFELLALDERLRPAETVLSVPAQASSVLAIPPLSVGWYEVRAIARGADGSIQSTPLPASFEVVP